MKEFSIRELNKDQLEALAALCFDLAKGALGLSIIPPLITSENAFVTLLKLMLGLFWGVAFTYVGLLLLKAKRRV